MLFTDIVDSTALAESMGPARWRELVGTHNERVQFELDRFRGRLVKTTDTLTLGSNVGTWGVGRERGQTTDVITAPGALTMAHAGLADRT